MQCLRIQTFFASYLGNHCNEVPLKRSFLFNGSTKLVPLSKIPIYPESQLSVFFLVKFSKEVQGTKENGLSEEKSHLFRVLLNGSILYFQKIVMHYFLFSRKRTAIFIIILFHCCLPEKNLNF